MVALAIFRRIKKLGNPFLVRIYYPFRDHISITGFVHRRKSFDERLNYTATSPTRRRCGVVESLRGYILYGI
jgi:hypothetical protein